jgi:hypothetical protein
MATANVPARAIIRKIPDLRAKRFSRDNRESAPCLVRLG